MESQCNACRECAPTMKAACCLTYALYLARIRASAVGASSSPWWKGWQHAYTKNTVLPWIMADIRALRACQALPHMPFQIRTGTHFPWGPLACFVLVHLRAAAWRQSLHCTPTWLSSVPFFQRRLFCACMVTRHLWREGSSVRMLVPGVCLLLAFPLLQDDRRTNTFYHLQKL